MFLLNEDFPTIYETLTHYVVVSHSSFDRDKYSVHRSASLPIPIHFDADYIASQHSPTLLRISKYMEAFDPRAQRFSGYLTFGHCGEQEDVKFIRVLENGKELRLHFRESQNITINQIKQTYFQISDQKYDKKEDVQFLNTLSNKFVNPQSIVTFCAEDVDEEPLVVNQSVDIKPQMFEPPIVKKIERQLQPVEHEPFGPTLKISSLNFGTFNISFQPNADVEYVIEQICQKKGVFADDFFLTFNGVKLKYGRTLQSYKIVQDSTVDMIHKVRGGCFSANTPITLADGSFKTIKDVQKGDLILSYDETSKMWKEDQVSSKFTTTVKYGIKITLENGCEINCTPDHKFFCQDGQWKSYQDISQLRLQPKQKLLHSSSLFTSIADISQIILPKEEEYYHLCTETYHNFVANGYLVHNMTINLKTNTNETFSVSVELTDKIEMFRKKIYQQKGMAVLSNQLKYAGTILSDDKSLADYGFSSSSIVLIDLGTSSPADCKKQIIMKVSSKEFHTYLYSNIRTWTFKQMIQIAVNNPSSYASILYGSKVLHSDGKVAEFQQELKATSTITLVLVRVEKLQFYKELKPNPQLKQSEEKLTPGEASSVQIIGATIGTKTGQPAYQSKNIYAPIVMYTCDSLYGAVNRYLIDLKLQSAKQASDQWMAEFSNCLVRSLEKLPNYIGTVYRGMRNYKHSSLYPVGSVFTWKSFTSTSKQQAVARGFSGGNTGTFFIIQCLTAKDVSMFSKIASEEQLLYPPFTYFIINRIVSVPGQCEEVWMSEMPSPSIWKHNMLLWVDDKPLNNISIISKILLSGNTEVLQLTSTEMAKEWMKEFGWVLVWTDIRIKVISDMVREQHTKKDKFGVVMKQHKKDNYFAGVDLLNVFFDDHGYTPQILIYCGAVAKGKENAIQRGVGKDRIFDITSDLAVVMKFSEF